jgi:hypothetical protein
MLRGTAPQGTWYGQHGRKKHTVVLTGLTKLCFLVVAAVAVAFHRTIVHYYTLPLRTRGQQLKKE